MTSALSEQELSLARRLAHTEKSVRDAAFALISHWLLSFESKDADKDRIEMLKMWKALFYCVWMSDKPAVQNELVTNLAQMLRGMTGTADLRNRATLFVDCFFVTMNREWAGLDRYRLDKYLLLIRRVLHEMFKFCEVAKWQTSIVTGVASVLTTAMQARPNGIRLHLADIFIDEMAGAVPEVDTKHAESLLAPLYSVMRSCDDSVVFERVVKESFEACLVDRIEAEGGDGDDEVMDGAGAAGSGKAKPLGKINSAAIARSVFSIAGDAATKGGHRQSLYALHKVFTRLALKHGHAKKEEECYPAKHKTEPAAAAPVAEVAAAPSKDGKGKKVKGILKQQQAVKPAESKPAAAPANPSTTAKNSKRARTEDAAPAVAATPAAVESAPKPSKKQKEAFQVLQSPEPSNEKQKPKAKKNSSAVGSAPAPAAASGGGRPSVSALPTLPTLADLKKKQGGAKK